MFIVEYFFKGVFIGVFMFLVVASLVIATLAAIFSLYFFADMFAYCAERVAFRAKQTALKVKRFFWRRKGK